jgi:NAD(P)-dependent dehydrogenase (short-subunit alcohol dehydrogenase family)
MLDLTGKVALITGGGQGVGLGIARQLGRQGASVVINDIHPERADAAVSRLAGEGVVGALAAPFDVSDREGVTNGISASPMTSVSCASIWPPRSPRS